MKLLSSYAVRTAQTQLPCHSLCRDQGGKTHPEPPQLCHTCWGVTAMWRRATPVGRLQVRPFMCEMTNLSKNKPLRSFPVVRWGTKELLQQLNKTLEQSNKENWFLKVQYKNNSLISHFRKNELWKFSPIYATGLILNLRQEGVSSHFLSTFYVLQVTVINSLSSEINHDAESWRRNDLLALKYIYTIESYAYSTEL